LRGEKSISEIFAEVLPSSSKLLTKVTIFVSVVFDPHTTSLLVESGLFIIFSLNKVAQVASTLLATPRRLSSNSLLHLLPVAKTIFLILLTYASSF